MPEPWPPYKDLFSKLQQTARSLMFWLGLLGRARGLLRELMRRRRAQHRGEVAMLELAAKSQGVVEIVHYDALAKVYAGAWLAARSVGAEDNGRAEGRQAQQVLRAVPRCRRKRLVEAVDRPKACPSPSRS